MKTFLYGIVLQWKLDLRNKGILLTYYIVPILFFIFMAGIFTSIDSMTYKTLIPSMTVFGVTMGAILGSPIPLVETFSGDIKKSYIVNKIPLWSIILNNFISSLIHLFIMSIIIFFIAPIVFDATIPSNLTIYFINLLIFIIASISLGTVLGLFIEDISKLTMICQFIFLPSIMLSGIMFSPKLLPKLLQSLGKLFPATWGYLNMCNSSLNINNLAPLICIITICILICIFKFKNLKFKN